MFFFFDVFVIFNVRWNVISYTYRQEGTTLCYFAVLEG